MEGKSILRSPPLLQGSLGTKLVTSTKLSTHTVTLSLQALKHLLPTDTSLELLTSYYTSSHHLTHTDLLPHFSQWLLACLGLPPESQQTNTEVGTLSQERNHAHCYCVHMCQLFVADTSSLPLLPSPLRHHGRHCSSPLTPSCSTLCQPSSCSLPPVARVSPPPPHPPPLLLSPWSQPSLCSLMSTVWCVHCIWCTRYEW